MPEVAQEKTGLGNYFVANYPPFSFWKPAHLPAAQAALDAAPVPGTPLGLYLHIPFCRKRCKFCYFRVYTDKNARDVEVYTDALVKEVELYARRRAVASRPLTFVYFGGGTPSYLSAAQLSDLMTRLKAILPWDGAEEVTFECEPGTLQRHKLETLREMGVTRLSLGVENFDPKILEFNGRAHLEEEIHRAYGWARELGFDQINIDLIAGMVGESWDNWRQCVAKTLALAPESITIYQMELPYNTVFSQELRLVGQDEPALAVADWPTKRDWVAYAFDTLQAAGYEVSSAYTLVKDKQPRPLRLPRQPVARGRHARYRSRVLRPRRRRSPAKRRFLGAIRRPDRPGRAAAGPCPAGRAARAADSRDDLAAQNRVAGPELFPEKV